MICLHVQNHLNCREERKKAVRILTCLCDKQIRLADTDISSDRMENSSDSDSRIFLCLKQNLRNHRGRCRLSVRSCNCNRLTVVLHNLTEKVCAGHHRNSPALCLLKLRVVRVYSCRVYNKLYLVRDVLCTLSIHDFCAVRGKLIRQLRLVSIRTADMKFFLKKNLSKSAHADSSDSDKMYCQRFFEIYLIHMKCPLLS